MDMAVRGGAAAAVPCPAVVEKGARRITGRRRDEGAAIARAQGVLAPGTGVAGSAGIGRVWQAALKSGWRSRRAEKSLGARLEGTRPLR